MTETTLTIPMSNPTMAAHYAYATFEPRSAGKLAVVEALSAASIALWRQADETLTALLVHYGQRRDMLNHNGPCRSLNDQLWTDGVRQSLMDRHRELLCCIMVALLIPNNVDPNKIAPADYAPIADIALANIRYGDHQ